MMGWFGFGKRKEERAASIENPTIPVSAENFLQFFGLAGANLPAINADIALQVPAFQAAVLFLSRTLANIPLHAYRQGDNGPEKLTGRVQTILGENPNDEMDTTKFRRYFWEQVFTGGRGLAWIERKGASIEALWPMDPAYSSVQRRGGRLVYFYESREYPASDVIDMPFMLRSNGVNHRGPLSMASKALQLSVALNDYAANFFAGGGIPPLSVTGPMPANKDSMRAAVKGINDAIAQAKTSGTPIFQIPPGYELKPAGFDPEKGQVTEARLFQVQEIARIFQIPPNFLGDLSRATYSNVEQNDLYLIKHLVSQWCGLLEGEMNLKIFGRMNGNRYVRHNLEGLQRGDFLSRLKGLTSAVQGAILTPDEAREIEGRPRRGGAADQLYMQGATVPLDNVDPLGGNTPSEPDPGATL